MNKSFTFLCLLLIFSVCLQNVLLLPYFGRSIQPTEFLFLFVLTVFPYRSLQRFTFSKNEKLFFFILAGYVCFNLLSSFLSSSTSSLIESAGRIYLFLLFLVIVFFLNSFTADELTQKVSSVFFITGAFLSVISLAGYLFAYLHITEFFVFNIADYPYLGTIYRLRGPAFTSTMLITILSCCIFFSLSNYQSLPVSKPYRIFFIGCMLLASILTFSKTILLTGWGLLLLYAAYKNILTKRILLISLVSVMVISVIATHFIFIKAGDDVYEKLKLTDFISNKKVFSLSGVTVLETSYVSLKKAAFTIGLQHPFTGIGTGNFNNELNTLKTMEAFPVKLPNYDPHSTYMGAFAETGVLGLILLMVLLWLLVKPYVQFEQLLTDRFYLCIFILLITFVIEGISTDIMNFRHLWVLFAVAFVYQRKMKRSA